ncbi:DUF5702 domain-containing protein [Vallitalea guaymasensis]|uniref:Uncharacterized protein n=1 Tax=Vallitalea guaymasensis TaxID=1185412 RepID=A0A8J8MCA8_9FIRM|nr:DUF5702 domain-containing protein [Vallitalea guaymasensis]QUH30331.1 hypothetical protein HYG85_16040 [Vallitalea guaymasensis]
MNKKTDGAVTVFLSCILLIIIVFTCTVIDSTRIRVARLQSLRALRNATNSILASYDSQISDEYGMFMLEKQDYINKIEEYANASLEPNEDLPEMNRIYKRLYSDDSQRNFNLYDYKLKVTSVMPTDTIVKPDTDYIRLEILEYMKYRAPLLVIEPILEKLNLITKASKTTDYVKKKMEITHKVSKIDDEYRELERLIDGLDISKKGKISYEDFYVKGIIQDKGITRDRCFKDIPDEYIRSRLRGTIFDIYGDINNLRDDIYDFNSCKTTMINTYKQLYYIRQEINELSDTDLGDQDELDHISECIERSNELHDSFINQLDTVMVYKDNIERGIANLSNLPAYLESNISAIEVIEKIQVEGNRIKESIDELENNINNDKEDIIEQTSNAIENELKDLKGKLAIEEGEDKTYTLVNNLLAIKDELQNNVRVLSNNVLHVNDLNNMKNDLFNHMLYGEFGTEEKDILYAFMDEIKTTSNLLSNQNSYMNTYDDNNYTEKFSSLLYQLENGLHNHYSTKNMVFNYGNMKSLSDEEKDKKDPRNEVTDATKNIKFNEEDQNVSDEIDKDNIPSVLSSNNEYINLINEEDADFENEENDNFTNKSLDVFGNIADKLKDITYNLRDEIYIGEYILGNFKSATDNLPDALPLTLSNYSKNDHYLNNEVEYILGGSLDENINLKHVSNTILGIRFVMNYIHILTNSSKRTLVMSIATSIAGWWTFGLGTYIVAALIMAAWSYAESCVDVRYLLQGRKVAFIKTSGDWYTSLQGIANGIIDEATDYVTDKSLQVIDAASKTVQSNISFITKRLEGSVSEYAEDKLSQVLDEAERSLNYTIDEVDNTIDTIINDSFNNLREGIDNRPLPDDYGNIGCNDLIKEIIDTIYNEYVDRIVDASYSQVISIKKEILEKFKEKIEQAKQKIINEVLGGIGQISNRFESEINEVVEKTSCKYKDITKKHINSIADKVRKSTVQKVNVDIDNSLKTKGKGSKITSLMPSFSYNDYLRLMLLIGVDDDVKLYRVLDLIQFNLQKSRNESEFNLKDYAAGLDVTAEVTVNFLFFDLPFMPDEAKGLADKGYSFEINTSMVY